MTTGPWKQGKKWGIYSKMAKHIVFLLNDGHFCSVFEKGNANRAV